MVSVLRNQGVGPGYDAWRRNHPDRDRLVPVRDSVTDKASTVTSLSSVRRTVPQDTVLSVSIHETPSIWPALQLPSKMM